MAKTYTTLTSVSTGDVLQATNFNNMQTTVNNHTVPPSCTVRRNTNQTSYTANTAITWETASWDTDSMFSAGSPTRITIGTAGVYLVHFIGYMQGTATISLVNPIILVNGSETVDQYVGISGNIGAYWSISGTFSLAASDYLTAAVNIVGGSAYSIYGTSTLAGSQTRLSATWLGKAS